MSEQDNFEEKTTNVIVVEGALYGGDTLQIRHMLPKRSEPGVEPASICRLP